MEAKFDPASIGRFEPEAYLAGGWRLVECVPGQALVLEQERGEQMRALYRTALALLVPLVLTVLLVVGTWATPGDMRYVSYPLAALFMGVVVLGVFAVRRSLRRVMDGVRLEVDARSATVTGMPEASLELGQTLSDFNARKVRGPLSDVEAVRLTVQRDVADAARRRRALASLSLGLRVDGKALTLQGPHAWAEDSEWAEARDALAPLGCELARVARRPLVIELRWAGETIEVTLAQVDGREPAPRVERRAEGQAGR